MAPAQTTRLRHTAGFTLIELLVVIGVLGILAAGLLAAIDPLEQLRKGRDTQKRNVAIELNNAVTRYYAIFGDFPWSAAEPETNRWLAAGRMTQMINTLIGVGELKPTFIQGLPGGAAASIRFIGSRARGEVFVCFNPESKAISDDPSTIFENLANPPSTAGGLCPSVTRANCYWCAR